LSTSKGNTRRTFHLGPLSGTERDAVWGLQKSKRERELSQEKGGDLLLESLSECQKKGVNDGTTHETYNAGKKASSSLILKAHPLFNARKVRTGKKQKGSHKWSTRGGFLLGKGGTSKKTIQRKQTGGGSRFYEKGPNNSNRKGRLCDWKNGKEEKELRSLT